MCGIAGIWGAEDRSRVQAMCDAIAHRGPDGEGIFTDAGVTLGHRRLAIIDLEGGAQPMHSHDGRFVIVYNGEIYNHQSVRAKLEAAGARFATNSDTEIILEGYRMWGQDVVGHLEGMFAFALWDCQERTLFIARDPFGIKPFFFAWKDGHFLFASEQKALFAAGVAPVANLDRIRERAALEFLTGQATLFRGVHQLPPGTYGVLRPGDHVVAWQPYYVVPSEELCDPVKAAKAIRERFVGSIKEQLMSEVPLGVILSGGLDSAAVAAIHQTILSDQPIDTFTIAESEEIADFQAARRLAEHLGTNHHESFFSLENVMQDLPRYTWHNENINYTEFFFLPLFEMMRRRVTVGLCGQGSDELWGGYQRYRDPLALSRERLGRLRKAAPQHEEHLAVQVLQNHQSGSALAEWDQQGQLNNFQLRLVDRNSMAHSLEVRVPFLSRPLHMASRGVPWAWKIHDDIEKWVLRKALEDVGLPDDLLWRPKLPAGRATGPRVMTQFEAEAERLIGHRRDRHQLAGSFQNSAEMLLFDLWNEVFIERDGNWRGLALEDLA